MKRAVLSLFGLLTLSGCGRLDTLLYSPPQTGQEWLASQPFVKLELASHQFILIQPSSTIFVYLLGLIAIAAGFYFFKIKENHRSRSWWGAALIFWGIGALLAGTSYQAFSYEIKCAGHPLCLWTSWWEILYMIFSVASVNAMMLAVARSSAAGKLRKGMTSYATLNSAFYLPVTLTGVFIPVKFLISFELMLVFLAPSILFMLFLSISRYLKFKLPLDRALIGTWLWLGATMAAYYAYLLLGFTEQLWEQGYWFSENDVLHIGLISWMLYIGLRLAKKVEDQK